MSSVAEAVSLASGKSQLFEAVLWFLPDWAQLGVAGVIVLAVLLSWVLKIRRRIARRRAAAAARAHQAAAAGTGGSGTALLGPYAPPSPDGPCGADFLGPYAPPRPPGEPSAAADAAQGEAADGPRGADFLGAYAPQRDTSV